LKLTNSLDDLAQAFDVRAQSAVKQEEQQGNQRQNYEIFQRALRFDRDVTRSGFIVATFAFRRSVR